MHVAVAVPFDAMAEFLRQSDRNRLAGLVGEALGDGDLTSAELAVDSLDVLEERRQTERHFRHVDQMRAVLAVAAPQRRRRRQPAGLSTHHDIDLDPRQGRHVAVVADERRGHKASGAAVARAVVGHAQVVIDGLGDMEYPQLVVTVARHLVDDAGGVGRVVAANVEEIPNVVLGEDAKDVLAVGVVGLVAAGAQGGRRGDGEVFQHLLAQALERDKVLFDDASHAVASAQQLADGRELSDRLDHAHQGLIDHGRRAAGLTDDGIAFDGAGFTHDVLLCRPLHAAF